jgi:hypothetical protein
VLCALCSALLLVRVTCHPCALRLRLRLSCDPRAAPPGGYYGVWPWKLISKISGKWWWVVGGGGGNEKCEMEMGTGTGRLAPPAPAPAESVRVGEDSHFFALLGSAPQELNTTRPEAKLKCWQLHARNPNRFFITLLLSRHSTRE